MSALLKLGIVLLACVFLLFWAYLYIRESGQ
jgi:hypothetical protein